MLWFIIFAEFLLSHRALYDQTCSCQWLPGHWVFRRDTKWLSDWHCGQSMTLPTSRWDTSLWLGHCTQHYESVNASHNSVQCTKKKCVWCGQIPCRDCGLAYDITAADILQWHLCVCGWNTLVHTSSGLCESSLTHLVTINLSFCNCKIKKTGNVRMT